MPDQEDFQRYRFGPLEARGLIGSVRAPQAALIGGGLVAAVIALRALPPGPNVLVALVLALAGAALAFYPIAGRTLEEWVPVASSFALRTLRGARRYRSAAPGLGARIAAPQGDGNGAGPAEGPPQPAVDLPPELEAIELLAAPYRHGAIGVVKDARERSYTAVLACRVGAFGLLEGAEQERRLAAWGAVLASLARERTPIRRLQWVERTIPSDGDEAARYFAETRDESIPLANTTVRSYLDLIEGAGAVTQTHEILVAVSLDIRRAGTNLRKLLRSAEAQPGPRRSKQERIDAAACTLLQRESETLAQRLGAAGVTVEGALTPGMLARAIREAYDPFGRAQRTHAQAADPDRDGIDPALAGPLAAEEGWDRYRSDSAHHATYWIAQWPRLEVAATFLQPLLMQTPIVRTVGVTIEPVPPSRSVREVEKAITEDIAEEHMKSGMGFRSTARKRLQYESTQRREQELAHGHAEMRMAGFVTVSARDLESLEADCQEAEHAAGRAHLDLVRMFGEQREAFTYTLPLGRGLR